MRCSMCGHESPAGSSFCLNCGSSLTVAPAPAFAQTPIAAAGLPVICPVCRGENPPGMKFCRACGSGLAGVQPTAPPQNAAPPMHPPPAYGAPGMGPPPGMGPIPATAPGVVIAPARGAAPSAAPGMVTCPRCGTATPVGFAYCQQCGLHMQGMQPTDPAQLRPPIAQPIPGGPLPAGVATSPNARPLPANHGVDPQGATLAADGRGAVAAIMGGGAPRPLTPSVAPGVAPLVTPMVTPGASGPAWGTAVLVNRDGSDGQRFSLVGEYCVVGRAGADIAFEDDRFLARQHARFERAADGSVTLLPLDTLNGVFRKAEAPVDLSDGMIVLVGREVLRFERVDPEETKVHPLVRHGVALFGSPPREPWGRLHQIIPSGGIRDIRHLIGDEVVLGREEGDIVFRDDAFMSRRHAALTWDKRTARITDLGSSNGTFVRISGPVPVKTGDHVRMGDQLLRIELGK